MPYEEVEIEDMEWSDDLQAYTYACPCGDVFQITKEELAAGEDIARCPSCSLIVHVIYNLADFAPSAAAVGNSGGAGGAKAVSVV